MSALHVVRSGRWRILGGPRFRAVVQPSFGLGEWAWVITAHFVGRDGEWDTLRGYHTTRRAAVRDVKKFHATLSK
jgi:hypothetical protein